MYCVNCGVELADSETVCPLCGTRVFHPDLSRPQADAPYPPDHHVKPEDVSRSGILFVMTMLALLPAVICLLCDWRINGGIVWSGFAAGAIGLLYVLIVLPMWFKRPNPVIFVPVDFAAILVSACDAFMLGGLNQNSLSAVSLASQITFVFNLILTALTIGENMFVAQYYGKRDFDVSSIMFVLRLCSPVCSQ